MIVLRGAISHIIVKNSVKENTPSYPCSLTVTKGKSAIKKPAPIAPASECTIQENQFIPYIFKIRSRNKAGIPFEMAKSVPIKNIYPSQLLPPEGGSLERSRLKAA
jgi:hypothetical protein